jgi:nitrite reductase/ring-hydroxylating ferredoxin subunit
VSTGPEPTTRRSFLATAAAGGACLGLCATGAAWGISLVPAVRYEPPTKRRLGPPESVPEGVSFQPDHNVFLFRKEGRLRALSAVCTHLGCTVQREDQGFHCPCHGSQFGAEGAYKGGPAKRSLPWHPLALAADGSLVVDLALEVGDDVSLALEAPK